MSLSDVRVLDLSQSAAGPYASQLLAELGAEVIMIEPPGGGDQRRLSKGAFFPNLGRGKRSVEINLKADGADGIMEELIKDADVFIHNYRPGSIERLGYDYDSVRELNEGIVYCSLTGYGDSGPYRNRPSLDPLAQAMSGLMSVTGEPDRKPSRIGASVIDMATGSLAAFGIVSALWTRDRTGTGQKVEASLLDTAGVYMGLWYTRFSRTGELPQRLGHSFEAYAPVGAFETEDGLVYLSVPYQQIWKRFCETIDRDEWISDPRFATDDDRTANREILHKLIEERFSSFSTEQLTELLLAADVPVSPVHTIDEAMTDRQLRTRGTIEEIEDETGSQVTVGMNPVKFGTHDETATRLSQPGEDTREVLHEVGFESDEIDSLKERGVVESR
jgi:crotonobetainyl-CoA:carnitine CoA-transferase CaiB-like acyl-CoA transferase